MIRAVADTHAIIWYLFEDERLSPVAREFMDDAAKDGEQIGISAISLMEIVYLAEKSKINPETFERLLHSIEADNAALVPHSGENCAFLEGGMRNFHPWVL